MKNLNLLEFDLISNVITFTRSFNHNTIKFYIYINKKVNNEYFTNITIDINRNANWEIEVFKKNISLEKLQLLINLIINEWYTLITNSSKDYIFSTSILSACCLKVFKNIKHNIFLTKMYKDKKLILKYRKKSFKYFLSPNFFTFPITTFNDTDATKDKNCPIPIKISA